MRRLAVLSDSHVPDRASTIPDPFRERIRAADRTVHAGDVTPEATLERFASLADGDLTAVAGNVDPGGSGSRRL